MRHSKVWSKLTMFIHCRKCTYTKQMNKEAACLDVSRNISLKRLSSDVSKNIGQKDKREAEYTLTSS
jgi:hypothetical protein